MRYDAVIIGAGQAGGPLANGLADAGWSVALVEREHLGGTCVNEGCTPTKTMVASAQVAHYARNAERWGVRASDVTVDLAAVRARKERVVQEFRSGLERKAAARPNLHLVYGQARFTGPQRVEVNGEILESSRIFINTGTRPEIPGGLEGIPYLTNATAMELTTVPEHLLVLGGGYIGLEFGQMFQRFGSRVTIIQRNGQIVPREDPEVAAELQRALEAEGVEFLLDARVTSAARDGDTVVLSVESGGQARTLKGSHLLVAAGRRPNTDDLGLDSAGVETDSRGYVRVNSRLETNVPGVWALGDVKGGPAFTHISYNDYQIVWGNLMEGKSLSTQGRIVPYTVFTDPQLGGVGMTEKEARAAGKRLKIGSIPAGWIARAIERDETAGLLKVIIDAGTDRILGASILCTEGGELVQILHAVVLAEAPYTVLKGAIYIHPTLAEGFWSLMDSVKPAD